MWAATVSTFAEVMTMRFLSILGGGDLGQRSSGGVFIVCSCPEHPNGHPEAHGQGACLLSKGAACRLENIHAS